MLTETNLLIVTVLNNSFREGPVGDLILYALDIDSLRIISEHTEKLAGRVRGKRFVACQKELILFCQTCFLSYNVATKRITPLWNSEKTWLLHIYGIFINSKAHKAYVLAADVQGKKRCVEVSWNDRDCTASSYEIEDWPVEAKVEQTPVWTEQRKAIAVSQDFPVVVLKTWATPSGHIERDTKNIQHGLVVIDLEKKRVIEYLRLSEWVGDLKYTPGSSELVAIEARSRIFSWPCKKGIPDPQQKRIIFTADKGLWVDYFGMCGDQLTVVVCETMVFQGQVSDVPGTSVALIIDRQQRVATRKVELEPLRAESDYLPVWISPNGRYLLNDAEGLYRLRDRSEAAFLKEPIVGLGGMYHKVGDKQLAGYYETISFSEKKDILATSQYRGGEVILFKIYNDKIKPITYWNAHRDEISVIELDCDANFLVTVGVDGLLKLWEIRSTQ